MSGRLIRQRRPNEASAFLAELERVGGAQAPFLREVQEAADLLDHEEFEHAGVGARLSWRGLFESARPPTREDREETERGEWTHGSQLCASSSSVLLYILFLGWYCPGDRSSIAISLTPCVPVLGLSPNKESNPVPRLGLSLLI